MHQWRSIELPPEELQRFLTALNSSISQKPDKVYFKVFTPKEKSLKQKIFYIADEGSEVIKNISEQFKLTRCSTPLRNTLTRVAGFSADRDWMF